MPPNGHTFLHRAGAPCGVRRGYALQTRNAAVRCAVCMRSPGPNAFCLHTINLLGRPHARSRWPCPCPPMPWQQLWLPLRPTTPNPDCQAAKSCHRSPARANNTSSAIHFPRRSTAPTSPAVQSRTQCQSTSFSNKNAVNHRSAALNSCCTGITMGNESETNKALTCSHGLHNQHSIVYPPLRSTADAHPWQPSRSKYHGSGLSKRIILRTMLLRANKAPEATLGCRNSGRPGIGCQVCASHIWSPCGSLS